MWKLYLDDERTCPYDDYIVARSTAEAIELVQLNGVPEAVSFDHDLGGDDTSLIFLKWWTNEHFDSPPQNWKVHSANPVGKLNIESFINSWIKASDTSPNPWEIFTVTIELDGDRRSHRLASNFNNRWFDALRKELFNVCVQRPASVVEQAEFMELWEESSEENGK